MGHPRESEPDDGARRPRAMVVVTCSKIVCSNGALLDPVPELSVTLASKAVLDARLLFFNDHYDIALLEITVDDDDGSPPPQPASIGSCPSYGDGVFILARDPDSSLMVRAGEILWLEDSNFIGRNYYMFLSCDGGVPPDGTGAGGPVIDRAGDVAGMAFAMRTHPAVLSVSTIATCLDMWAKHGRVARPVHGLWVRTMAMLDVALQEEIASGSYGVEVTSGFIVDFVEYDPAAEALGIQSGDVVSFDGRRDLTLPELEDYFLSLGWRFLQDPSSVVELKLEVYDPMGKSKRSIALPVEFCDASERVI